MIKNDGDDCGCDDDDCDGGDCGGCCCCCFGCDCGGDNNYDHYTCVNGSNECTNCWDYDYDDIGNYYCSCRCYNDSREHNYTLSRDCDYSGGDCDKCLNTRCDCGRYERCDYCGGD